MPLSIADLCEEQRRRAMQRFEVIKGLLHHERLTQGVLCQAAGAAGRSPRTIRRWFNLYRKEGLRGLAVKRRTNPYTPRAIPPDLIKYLEGLYLEKSHRSIATVHRMAQGKAEQLKIPHLSYTTVWRVCKAIPREEVCMARKGVAAYRDNYEMVCRYEADHPNQLWQLDHCKVDVLAVNEEKGKPLRPWLTAVLDTCSRALTGYHLSFDTPSSMSVALALRCAIWHKPHGEWSMCGIPEQLHMDNGADLTSEHIRQVAADLKIDLIYATPNLPRTRGKIERFFSTLNTQLWSELPGYVGSNPKDRPEKVNPSLSLKQLEGYLVGYILNLYHKRPHSATGRTPEEVWNLDFVPRMPPSLRALDLLLMQSSRQRKVQKDGVHFMNLRYWSDVLSAYIGESVDIRYDPRDLAVIYVYHGPSFLCEAYETRMGGWAISLKELMALQRKRRKEVKARVLDKIRAAAGSDIAEHLIPHPGEQWPTSGHPHPIPPQEDPLALYRCDLEQDNHERSRDQG